MDLISPKITKLRETGAPEIIIIPKWPRQCWYYPELAMANRVTELKDSTAEVRTAQRRMNPKWCAVLLDLNLEN